MPKRNQGPDDPRPAEAPEGAQKDGGGPGASRGVYMISVAAQLAGMHPQTLRI
jgi:hypothetical protein